MARLRPPRLLRERSSGAVRRLIAVHPLLVAAIDPILVARDRLSAELAAWTSWFAIRHVMTRSAAA